MHLEATNEQDWRWSTGGALGAEILFFNYLTHTRVNVMRRFCLRALMESWLEAVDMVGWYARSWSYFDVSSHNCANEEKTVNYGWMWYLGNAVIGVCCTRYVLYSVCAVLGMCCTWYVRYSVCAVLGMCCTRSVLYLVSAVLSVCCTWSMLYLVYAVLSVCCTWSMLYLVYAVLGVCCTGYMLYPASILDHGMVR